jgi:hypothetical protein
MRKLYSRPLTLFEIDLLHYTSTATDKEYFADALILKAIDERGRRLFIDTKKEWLLALPKEQLEKMYLEMFDNEIDFKDLH